MTTSNAISIADLLDALRAWLSDNPGGDIDMFAAEHGVTVDDISDSWSTYFSADFSRDYDLDTTQTGGYQSGGAPQPQYTPQPPPVGSSPQIMKEYIVAEVHNYQEFTTVNNIEDNSFNQQITAGGDVNQTVDIDNSENIADDGSVLIRDTTATNSNIGAGDSVVGSEDVLDGDVTVTAGENGQAQSGINFGEGDVQQNQQDQDVDVTNTGDNTSGNTGSADGTGGAGTGGYGSGSADGGDGGNGGFNPYLDDPIPVEPDGGPGGPVLLDDPEPFEPAGGDGGDGGDGGMGGTGTGTGGAGTGGAGTGGTSGDSGDAGNDVTVTQEAPVF